jgi:hypothetical protein
MFLAIDTVDTTHRLWPKSPPLISPITVIDNCHWPPIDTIDTHLHRHHQSHLHRHHRHSSTTAITIIGCLLHWDTRAPSTPSAIDINKEVTGIIIYRLPSG